MSTPSSLTVDELIRQLRQFPFDAEVRALNVHPNGDIGDSFRVVNAQMDHVIGRAILFVEP